VDIPLDDASKIVNGTKDPVFFGVFTRGEIYHIGAARKALGAMLD
jgi:hypothetical protein